ncbi:MAG: alpha-galactosidase [Clostridia bacterium]|nr:alpha-galactosidase [Clostridia bacterium]
MRNWKNNPSSIAARVDANDLDVVFDQNAPVAAQAEYAYFASQQVVRQHNHFTAQKPVTLTRAATKVEDICFQEEGIASRLNDGSILIHYCISRWQGEGQWRQATPEYLGIYPATEHDWERSWWRLQSISSWSTATYAPMILIEDKRKNETWFFTIEAGRSWFFEIYGIGGRKGMKSLSVVFGGADEQLGFAKKMEAGEQYVSADCVYGVVEGGFEQAVQTLVGYWRESSLTKGGSPLVFNDYMNCNWAQESDKTLIPLIDKAAELGCEIFCLDDGWQRRQGVWFPADEKFGDEGLQGIFRHIREKGMQAGVWFEFETLPPDIQNYVDVKDCFLFRNDAMVTPYRPLANFRSESLVAYLNRQVDALYDMGVRFIKNDHNNTEHLGTTMYGESSAEGLEKNEQAFLTFIEGIRKRHPDLILENCASGGMRADAGTLKHFHIQSTSDQEDYLQYPSVLAGSLALMPPEKAGIWCYPYPLCFDDRQQLELREEQLSQFADGEQTVFNVVSGFMGNLYLSGKLHQADDYNNALLQEGLELYRKMREDHFTAVPVFPCGMISITERRPYAMGLWCERNQTLTLAVWNLSEQADSLTVDLRRYAKATCKVQYPASKDGVTFAYEDGILKVRFEAGKMARLFTLK